MTAMESHTPETLVTPENLQRIDSLTELSSRINDCFLPQISSVKIMNNVATQLQKFGSKGIQSVINDILTNEDLLIETAANSYLHKNGFYKIILIDKQNFRVRFHFWMPGCDSKETLHNHRWHIASAIINGSLKSEIWEDSASCHAKLYDEYMYTGKHVNPHLIGKARVEFVKYQSHMAGESYILQPHVLHRIISQPDEMTATLICRSSSACTWSRNIILNDLVPNVIPQYLNPDDLSRVLKQYLSLANPQTI